MSFFQDIKCKLGKHDGGNPGVELSYDAFQKAVLIRWYDWCPNCHFRTEISRRYVSPVMKCSWVEAPVHAGNQEEYQKAIIKLINQQQAHFNRKFILLDDRAHVALFMEPSIDKADYLFQL